MNNYLSLLQEWYKSQCNGDWEHDFGVKIETLDNPGWYVIIDLEDTDLEDINVSETADVADDDWYNIQTKDKKLICSSDANKLEFLLMKVTAILKG
jgi:hypothetical protein